MTHGTKFAQTSLLLQDMEHSLKQTLTTKPSQAEMEVLVRNEIDNLYEKLQVDLNKGFKNLEALLLCGSGKNGEPLTN